jgi:hypothetical protein
MAFPTKLTIYKENDLFIQLSGLSNGLDPAEFYNAATVTATLKDRSGTNVTDLTNVTLSYVAASDGVYRGSIPDSFDSAVGGGYILYIDADQTGITGHWELAAEVKVRKS